MKLIPQTNHPATRRACALGSLVSLLVISAFGQTPPRPAANSALSAAAGEDPVQLSVFEVTSEKDIGYVASTALAGTRTNEKLENLPNSISVMTHEFLEDMAFNNYFDAVGFAVNAENVANDVGTVGAPVGSRTGNQINFRGLATIRQLRDGFPWYVPADTFNTERIEFSRGPGGLAYGDVDAGGIINIASKRATFRRNVSAQVRYDSFGTQRYSIDVNQPLVPNRAAVRVNAIRSEVEHGKQRQGRDLEGYAVSLRLEPFKHRRTQIDIAAELGKTTAHLGHLGPTDSRIAYIPGSGSNALDADPLRPGVQTNGIGMRQVQAATSQNNAWIDQGGVIYSLKSTPTVVYRITVTNEGATAATGTDPQNPLRLPLLRVPESIIPYDQDWAGPDNKQRSKYHAYTVEFKHSFSERLNLLIAHNGQVDDIQKKQTYSNVTNLNGSAGRSLFIDVNPVLPNPNGPGTIPNPNFEKLFILHAPLYAQEGRDIQNWRGQLVYDARLPWDIRQRVLVGANYRHEKNYSDNFGFSLTREEIARRGITGNSAYYTNNLVSPIHYLHEGNADRTLGWNVTPGITHLFRHNAGGNLNRRLDQSLTSGSISFLGAYFKDKVRTSIGLSREHWLQSASRVTRADTSAFNEQRFVALDNSLIPNRGTEDIPVPLEPFADEWTTNQTYGGVWHALSWLSLTAGYFESSQFSDNYGLDLQGNALQPLNGEGHDFSARFRLFGGRLEASVTYFETRQENLNSSISTLVRDELAPLLAVPFVNLVDYRDRLSTGWEFQVVANLTRNWTLSANYSNNKTVFTRFYPLLENRLTEARATAQARGLNPDDATSETRDYLGEQEDNLSATKRATASLTTRYTFTEGALKGFAVGVGARYQQGRPWTNLVVGGIELLPAIETKEIVLTNPFFSYRRKFGRTNWTFQLNVNNVFDRRINQGNSYRWPRYTEPRQFVYTTTVAL
jgi:outer membrane receptor for ferric coprogen and ferric-rhodotorulic acid